MEDLFLCLNLNFERNIKKPGRLNVQMTHYLKLYVRFRLFSSLSDEDIVVFLIFFFDFVGFLLCSQINKEISIFLDQIKV